MKIAELISEALDLRGKRVVVNDRSHPRHGQVGVVTRSHGMHHEVQFTEKRKDSQTFSQDQLKAFPKNALSNKDKPVHWID